MQPAEQAVNRHPHARRIICSVHFFQKTALHRLIQPGLLLGKLAYDTPVRLGRQAQALFLADLVHIRHNVPADLAEILCPFHTFTVIRESGIHVPERVPRRAAQNPGRQELHLRIQIFNALRNRGSGKNQTVRRPDAQPGKTPGSFGLMALDV